MPTLKWLCNFNAQIWTKSPWISLYTQLFPNQHTKNELKKLLQFTLSKFAPYPPCTALSNIAPSPALWDWWYPWFFWNPVLSLHRLQHLLQPILHHLKKQMMMMIQTDHLTLEELLFFLYKQFNFLIHPKIV